MYVSKCKPSQFSDSGTPRKLGNWEIPRSEFCRSKPGITDCRRTGFTRIIANDKGHLFSTAKKAEGGPWSDYVNSFDMPSKIPGPNTTNPMARTKEQVVILKKKFDDFQKELCSHRGKISTSKNLKPKVVRRAFGKVKAEGEPNVAVCRRSKVENNSPPQSAEKDKSKSKENSNNEDANCEQDKSKLKESSNKTKEDTNCEQDKSKLKESSNKTKEDTNCEQDKSKLTENSNEEDNKCEQDKSKLTENEDEKNCKEDKSQLADCDTNELKENDENCINNA